MPNKLVRFAGGTGVPDKYYSYQYETPIGKYDISPVGNKYGKMTGYRVLREWSEILGMVNSPQKGIRVAQQDMRVRIGNKRFKV